MQQLNYGTLASNPNEDRTKDYGSNPKPLRTTKIRTDLPAASTHTSHAFWVFLIYVYECGLDIQGVSEGTVS